MRRALIGIQVRTVYEACQTCLLIFVIAIQVAKHHFPWYFGPPIQPDSMVQSAHLPLPVTVNANVERGSRFGLERVSLARSIAAVALIEVVVDLSLWLR